MLVPGVVGISIMFQGIQAVALPMSTEFGYTREIEDRVQAPVPDLAGGDRESALRRRAGAARRRDRVPDRRRHPRHRRHAHLSSTGRIVLTLIPLACVAMSSLGLLLGTTFEPRNIGLMFGFVVLPLTFLGGTYYQWTQALPRCRSTASTGCRRWC